MNIIIFGPPGAGKGTQSKKIIEHFSLKHLSTGDMMRAEVQSNSKLGKKFDDVMKKGMYVSDNLTFELLKKNIEQNINSNGFLFDGYPRNLNQVKMLETIVSNIDYVIKIDIDENIIIDRLINRRTCVDCKNIINLKQNNVSKCPICNGKLIKRKDDEENAIKKRFEVYNAQTKPILNHYANCSKVITVNGNDLVENITKAIINNIN